MLVSLASAMVVARFVPAIVFDPVATFATQLRAGPVPTETTTPKTEEETSPSQEYLERLRRLLKGK